jgi:hypothetical protein
MCKADRRDIVPGARTLGSLSVRNHLDHPTVLWEEVQEKCLEFPSPSEETEFGALPFRPVRDLCRFWLRTSSCAVGPFWSLRRWLRVAAQRSYHGFLMTSNKVRSYVSEVPEDSAWSRGGGPP